MSKLLSAIWAVLREFFMATIAQPSNPRLSEEDRKTHAYQTEALRRRAHTATSASDAARAVSAEVAKAVIGQPTPAPRADPERTKEYE